MLKSRREGDRKSSTSKGIPSLPRARITARVASACRCSDTSAWRTASNRATAPVTSPATCSRSPQTTQASATASRSGLPAANAFESAAAASGVPILPSAAAAAAATFGSSSLSRLVKSETAVESRRTPSELIAPTSCRLASFVSGPAAARSAADAASPGITSSVIRAHEASRSLPR